jgi:putative hydrolase of the HAD superfamily
MAKLAGVLFDLGNTLLHFDGAWPEVMQAADAELLSYLQQEGFQLDPEAFIREFRKRLDEYYVQRESEFVEYTTALVLRTLLTELGNGRVDDQRLRPALKRLYAVSQAHWKLEDDAVPMLEALKAAGHKLAIISNASDDEDVQTLVDNAHIRPYFDLVLSSAACGIRKPNPRIFEIALERLGLQPGQAAMVGDTLGADILGARNAGLYSIWITRRADTPDNRDHDDTIAPDAQIATLAELPGLLAGI